jgi:hypothetical protein
MRLHVRYGLEEILARVLALPPQDGSWRLKRD